jgi:hypothetical protein
MVSQGYGAQYIDLNRVKKYTIFQFRNIPSLIIQQIKLKSSKTEDNTTIQKSTPWNQIHNAQVLI